MTDLREIIVDLFAGGGGASEGIEQALGRPVDIAINHDEEAIVMHRINHPETKHYPKDVFSDDADPKVITKGRPVGLLWASPDCTHFSRAKGGKPVKKEIRGLAWVVVKWARLPQQQRPRIIVLENVSEFQSWGPLDEDNQPIKSKAGMTFNLWSNQLRGLGYEVQFRVLCAADYGAPTIRKRLFMIARCDGEAIVWPEPTHGQPGNKLGLPPYRTAAECIDWSLPCPSIFLTKKEALEYGVRRPLAENTLRRIAKGLQKYVLETNEPFIFKIGQTGSKGFRIHGIDEPIRTVVSKAEDCLVMPYFNKYHGPRPNAEQDARGGRLDKPIKTIDTQNRFALVSAFLSKYYNCSKPCASINKPTPTVTAIDHNALVTTHLTKFYNTNIGSDMREPMPTITSSGNHIGEVRAFLIKYYGVGTGQKLSDPMHTVTTKDRLGLVTVEGQDYQIVDIGLRMLQPHELARAQGFPDSYVMTGTKGSMVAKIGNSVPPPFAKAIIKANVKIKEKRMVG